jgi:hypothetical protein
MAQGPHNHISRPNSPLSPNVSFPLNCSTPSQVQDACLNQGVLQLTALQHKACYCLYIVKLPASKPCPPRGHKSWARGLPAVVPTWHMCARYCSKLLSLQQHQSKRTYNQPSTLRAAAIAASSVVSIVEQYSEWIGLCNSLDAKSTIGQAGLAHMDPKKLSRSHREMGGQVLVHAPAQLLSIASIEHRSEAYEPVTHEHEL